MKKTFTFLTVLVLTLSLLAGCGCRNSKPAATTAPTMPSVTTVPTTETTTVPTTMETEPSVDATIEDGNGPISTDSTTATDENNSRSRSGGMIGDSGMMEGTGSGNGITGSITG